NANAVHGVPLPRLEPPRAKPPDDRRFRLNPLILPEKSQNFPSSCSEGKDLVCSLALPGAELANFKAYLRPRRASADYCLEMWHPRGGRVPALSAWRDWR